MAQAFDTGEPRVLDNSRELPRSLEDDLDLARVRRKNSIWAINKVVAQHPRRALGGWAPEYVGWRASLEETALVQESDAVPQEEPFLEVVRHVERGSVVGAKHGAQLRPQFNAQGGVERGERFVQQKEVGTRG